jgi:hypothetical protein
MKNELLDYRRRLSNYNRWEKMQQNTLSANQKLREFLILFNLADYMEESEIRKQQKLHLENLVAMQKRSRKRG